MTERADYIAGLRALADLLESTPELPLPTEPSAFEWQIGYKYPTNEAKRAGLAEIARLIPGRFDKNDPAESDYNAKYFELTGRLAGILVRIWAERDAVCRRVVTGTRQVTEMVPAPDAPLVAVTKTVEDVEWRCEPLLAEAVAR